MSSLKKWWKEILIVISFIALIVWGGYIKTLLEQYNVTTPAVFWVVTEILYDVSILLFAVEWKGKKFVVDVIKGKGLLSSFGQLMSLSKENAPNKMAWNWFRVNRIVALLQPGVTAIMVWYASAPLAIKGTVSAFLIADFLHTVWVIIRSKAWQTSSSR